MRNGPQHLREESIPETFGMLLSVIGRSLPATLQGVPRGCAVFGDVHRKPRLHQQFGVESAESVVIFDHQDASQGVDLLVRKRPPALPFPEFRHQSSPESSPGGPADPMGVNYPGIQKPRKCPNRNGGRNIPYMDGSGAGVVSQHERIGRAGHSNRCNSGSADVDDWRA